MAKLRLLPFRQMHQKILHVLVVELMKLDQQPKVDMYVFLLFSTTLSVAGIWPEEESKCLGSTLQPQHMSEIWAEKFKLKCEEENIQLYYPAPCR